MAPVGRPRLHPDDRTKWRETKRASRDRLRRAAVAPGVPFRQIGPHCTVYCSDWHAVAALLPRNAAVVTDPPYPAGYDYTKMRRRASRWAAANFPGMDPG